MIVILFLVGIGCVAAVALVPSLMPWPQRIRWLLASLAVPDPTAMSTGVSDWVLREASISDVDRPSSRVEISSMGRPTWHTIPPGAATVLTGWAIDRVPLLLVTHPDGDVSLHGPSDAVAGLRPLAGVGSPR